MLKSYLGPVMLKFMGLITVMSVCQSHLCAEMVKIDLKALSMVESSGRSQALGDCESGKCLAYGLFQTHQGVVTDFNKAHNTKIELIELREPYTAMYVTRWYLDERIPQMLKPHEPTLEAVLTCYNAGCSKYKRGYVAKKYIAKYKSYLKG